MKNVILHNARCSKSRCALELLEEKKIPIDVRDYISDTPSIDELRAIVTLLGERPAAIVRRGEARYKELGVDVDTMSDEDVLRLLVENPILIERPIIVYNGRAVVGRPPERVLDII